MLYNRIMQIVRSMMQHSRFVVIVIACLLSKQVIQTHVAENKPEPLKLGNLALSASQQPGPLFGFGQNIIDKGDFLFYNFFDALLGDHKTFIDIAPGLLYGLRDDLSLYLEVPIAPTLRLGDRHSSGLEDILVQLEYAPYSHNSQMANKQITTVTSIYLPTGSIRKFPITGADTPSFFLGLTANYLATDWYCYVSPGGIITTEYKNTKAGSQFLYQAGFGRNIAYKTDRWILTWIVEMSGNYTQKRKIDGLVNPNTGGNVILLGPSLWFSTPRFLMQAGVAGVPYQNLFGTQFSNKIYWALNCAWKF